MQKLNYMIRHTGTSHLNNSSIFDEKMFYDYSGMTSVKTKCVCKQGKTISFYFNAIDDSQVETKAGLIEKEIKDNFDNTFLHCDSCEEYILEEIRKEYI